MNTKTQSPDNDIDMIAETFGLTEGLCKMVVINVVETLKEKHSEADIMRTVVFAVLEFGLKLGLMATTGVDDFRGMVDRMVDNLVQHDEDVQRIFEDRKKAQN
jgi:hypothetical protein